MRFYCLACNPGHNSKVRFKNDGVHRIAVLSKDYVIAPLPTDHQPMQEATNSVRQTVSNPVDVGTVLLWASDLTKRESREKEYDKRCYRATER